MQSTESSIDIDPSGVLWWAPNAKVHKVSVTTLILDTLPNIGDSLTLPASATSKTYKVTSVNVSGVTATITGELNA